MIPNAGAVLIQSCYINFTIKGIFLIKISQRQSDDCIIFVDESLHLERHFFTPRP